MNKKPYILMSTIALFICCSWVIPSWAGWVRITVPSDADLLGITFVDDLRGWCVGEKGMIINTTDGGKTWHKQTSGVETTLHDVCFINPTNGWIVGDDGTLLRTENGGITWIPVTLPKSRSLYGVDFIDDQRGWIVGSLGAIFYTSDGGNTWSESLATRMSLQDVEFTDGQKGWAVGITGVVLHSEDGGKIWKPQDSTTQSFLYGVSFASPNEGWAVGDDGTILVTRDGGKTWSRQNSGVNCILRDVYFVDPTLGWAIGDNGTILKTMNGGQTWQKDQIEGATSLASIDRGGTSIWVSGSAGTVLVLRDVTMPEISVSAAAELDQSIRMPQEPTVGFASLTINSTPQRCKIMIDGKLIERKTPATIDELVPGRHEIKVMTANRGTVTKTVSLKEGEQKTINVKLPTRSRPISILAGVAVIGGITFAVLQFFAGGI